MKLKSAKYPEITYEKGEEIFLGPGDANLTFYFDVEEGLTENEEAMAVVAAALDEVDTYAEAAKVFLKKVLSDNENDDYGTVAYFMEFHRDDMEPEAVAKLFPVDNPSALSLIEMVDYLQVNRFGSLVDNEEQGFIMDLNFNPEITDELMVIYFDLDKQVTNVAHES